MWAIVYKRTNRYYTGESWDRLIEDYRPSWGLPGDTSKAETYTTKEGAERCIKRVLMYAGSGCEAVEI